MKLNFFNDRRAVGISLGLLAILVFPFSVAESTLKETEKADRSERLAEERRSDWDFERWTSDGIPFLPNREKETLDALFSFLTEPTFDSTDGNSQKRNVVDRSNAAKNDFDEKSLGEIGFAQLNGQSKAYRGKIITIQGRLLRSKFVAFDASSADDGQGFYENWVLLDDEKKTPARLLTRTIPTGFVPDVPNADCPYRKERIAATGVYYRLASFSDGSDFYNSPIVLARSFELSTFPTDRNAADRSDNRNEDFRGRIQWIVVLIFAFVWILFRRRIRRGKNFSKNLKPKFLNEPSQKFFLFFGTIVFLSPLFVARQDASLASSDSTNRVRTNADTPFPNESLTSESPRINERSIIKTTIFNSTNFNENKFFDSKVVFEKSENFASSSDDSNILDPNEIPGVSELNWDAIQSSESWRKFSDRSPKNFWDISPNFRQAALQSLFRLKETIPLSFLTERLGDSRRNDFNRRGVVRFFGTLERVEPIRLSPDESQRFGFSTIFVCVVSLNDESDSDDLNSPQEIIVFARTIPKFQSLLRKRNDATSDEIRTESTGIGEKVGGTGLYFLDSTANDFASEAQNDASNDPSPSEVKKRTKSIVFLNELAWFNQNSLLGELGLNLALLEKIDVYPPSSFDNKTFFQKSRDERKRLLNSLRLTSVDRLPFYEIMAICQKMPKGSLLQELKKRRSNDKSPLNADSSDSSWNAIRSYFEKIDRSNETKQSSQTSNQGYLCSSPELFRRPEIFQGTPVYLRGIVKRASLILTNDPEIQKLYRIDRYYQLAFFADDSEGNPLILCVPTLPEGFPCGLNEDFREEIEFAGFFYKTWTYQTSKSVSELDRGDSSNASRSNEKTPNRSAAKNWIRVPLLIGGDVVWRPSATEKTDSFSRPSILTFSLTTIVLLALALIFYRRLFSKRETIVFKIGKRFP